MVSAARQRASSYSDRRFAGHFLCWTQRRSRACAQSHALRATRPCHMCAYDHIASTEHRTKRLTSDCMLRRFHEFGGYDNNNVLIPPQHRHPATIRFFSAREQLFIPPVELCSRQAGDRVVEKKNLWSSCCIRVCFLSPGVSYPPVFTVLPLFSKIRSLTRQEHKNAQNKQEQPALFFVPQQTTADPGQRT